MPHEVEQMFSSNNTFPWHYYDTADRTTVLEGYPQDWQSALDLAGLGSWDPQPCEIFRRVMDDETVNAAVAGILTDAVMTETERVKALTHLVTMAYASDTGFRGVERSDDHKILAVPTEAYQIIKNSEFGEILEAVLEVNRDLLKCETGGELDAGRKVWMMVRLEEPIVIPGDLSGGFPYVALTAKHNAKGGVTARALNTRIVCGNTFQMAELEGERSGAVFTFRHNGPWQDKVEDARKAISGVRDEAKAYARWAQDMLGIKVDDKQTAAFIDMFIPAPPDGMTSDRVKGNIAKSRTSLADLIKGPSVTGAEIDGTVYGLVQAAGEYLDHVRKSRSWETKLRRSVLSEEPLKHQAVKLALEAAKL